jgi:hypothetical protein
MTTPPLRPVSSQVPSSTATDWAIRIAANVGSLGDAETAALVGSASLRDAVHHAFKRLYGEDAKLHIKVFEQHLSIAWERPPLSGKSR